MDLDNTQPTDQPTSEPTQDVGDLLFQSTEASEIPTEQPTDSPATQDAAPEQPATEPAEQPKDEKLELLRQIAQSPERRYAYEMATYGHSSVPAPQAPQQQQSPPSAPQQPQQIEQQPQLPFDPEEYDPTDFNHQMALINMAVKSQLDPALSYINELKQVEQQESQQQQQQQVVEQVQAVEQEIVKSFESHIPGYGELYKAENPSTEQKAIIRFAEQEFQDEMVKLHPPTQEYEGQPFNPLWLHPQAQREIVDRIGPHVKAMAEKLGVFAPAQPKAKKVSGVYMEGANSVPGNNTNPFDAAAKAGDTAGMFEAIGYTA